MIVTAEPLDGTCSLSGHVGIHGSRGPQNQKEDELLPRDMGTAGSNKWSIYQWRLETKTLLVE